MIKYQKPSIKNSLFPIHPGEHLADCLDDYEMTPAELDAGLAVPAGTTALLLDGCLDITPELALRLGCYFGGSGKMGAIWLRLQFGHDLRVVGRKRGADIKAQVTPMPDADDYSYFVCGY